MAEQRDVKAVAVAFDVDLGGVDAVERRARHQTDDAHPIHLHGGQFQIVSRAVTPAWQEAASTLGKGLLDEGWKDTFLLRPGERVRVRVRFANHAGLFLYHCHNLEHEDMGMMRNFLVGA